MRHGTTEPKGVKRGKIMLICAEFQELPMADS